MLFRLWVFTFLFLSCVQLRAEVTQEIEQNIYAALYDDSGVCDVGVPVIVAAPKSIGEHEINTINIIVHKDEFYFQGSLSHVEAEDEADGVVFCSNVNLLGDTKIVLSYGYNPCEGSVHSFFFDGFASIVDGVKVLPVSRSLKKSKSSQAEK